MNNSLKTEEAPRRLTRILAACVVATLIGAYVYARAAIAPRFTGDFDPIWYAARTLLAGGDPYAVIGPTHGNWPWPLYYPLPALLIAAPLAPLPAAWARVAFIGVSSGLLVFGLSRIGWRGLIPLASGAFLGAVIAVQWSPLISAAMLLPSLAWIAAAKPNLGLVQLSAWPTRRTLSVAIAGGAFLVAVSFALRPSWLGEWLAAIHDAPHIRPLAASWLGAPLLLAALRWRRPDARVLLATAVVPMNPGINEALPLLVVMSSGVRTDAAILAALSFIVDPIVGNWPAYTDYTQYAAAVSRATLLCVYLPALVMVLRHRNEGEIPTWLERATLKLPAWLRGRSALMETREPDIVMAARSSTGDK